MANLKFSVLMPVYIKERPEHLKEAIESIINQRMKPAEIVIIKDGVITNELSAVISDYSRSYPGLFNVISFPKRIGLGKALNIGVERCNFNIIARMDSDDLCHEERFKEEIGFLEVSGNIDIVGSWIGEFEFSRDNIISIRKVPTNHEEIYKYAKFRNPFNHMTVIFKKEAVLKAGNYQNCELFEDYYLWVRMLINGSRGANIPSNLVYARIGNEMVERRRGMGYLKSEIRFERKIFDNGFLSCGEFLRNVVCRTPIRLMNKVFLKIVYQKFARAKFKDAGYG